MDNETYMHLAAYRGNVVNGTVNTAIPGVQDNILTKASSGAFFAPKNGTIWAGAAGGVNASRARINTPVLRAIGLPYIAPLNQGVTIPSPPNLSLFGDQGPRPSPTDEVSIESTHTDIAAQIQYGLLWFKFANTPQPMGQEYRLRFTASIAAVIGSWAGGALTFDQNVPQGDYAIVGMDLFGANLIAGRLIFIGGGWRPGVLARNSVGSVPHRVFLDSPPGVLGVFSNTALPQLEVYAEAANAAQEGYLDVVKIR